MEAQGDECGHCNLFFKKAGKSQNGTTGNTKLKLVTH